MIRAILKPELSNCGSELNDCVMRSLFSVQPTSNIRTQKKQTATKGFGVKKQTMSASTGSM
jgi:hypothetical protein